MTQPYKKIRVSGGVEICFWKREVDRNGIKFNILQPSVSRSWRNREGNWENRSVSLQAISQLYELLATAGEVRKIHNDFRAENRPSGGSDEESSEPNPQAEQLEKDPKGQTLFKEKRR